MSELERIELEAKRAAALAAAEVYERALAGGTSVAASPESATAKRRRGPMPVRAPDHPVPETARRRAIVALRKNGGRSA